MRLSRYTIAGLTCLFIAFATLSGCSGPVSPTTVPPVTTSPTVATTEAEELKIEKDAFNGSTIAEFTLDEGIEFIEEGAFANCSELKAFYCPSRTVSIDKNAFSGSENIVFHCYLGSTADMFARANGYERIYFDAFSLQCDTVNNGCAGLPITWSAVDVMPGQDVESQFVYTVSLNGEPVFTSEPTSEMSFVYTPAEGGEYSLAVQIINDLTQSSLTSETVAVADKLILGHFEQNNDKTTAEPIEWRIIGVEDGKALVISEKILTRGSYFNPEWIKYKYTYWSHSCVGATSYKNYWGSAPEHPDRLMGGLSPESVPLSWHGERGPETELFYLHARFWCNDIFYKKSFSDVEKERILLSHLTNPDNPVYGVDGGPDTDDYVFFLSCEEMDAYMPNREDRIAYFTTFADNLPVEYGERDAYYWLRTPGIYRINAMYALGESGAVTYYGSDVGHNMVGYRPAMWITVGG